MTGKVEHVQFKDGEWVPGDGFRSSSYYILDDLTKRAVPVTKKAYNEWLATQPKRRLMHETITLPPIGGYTQDLEVDLCFEGVNRQENPHLPPGNFFVNVRVKGEKNTAQSLWGSTYEEGVKVFRAVVEKLRMGDV